MSSIADVWQRFVGWIGDNEPSLIDGIGAPATQDQLARCEAAMGRALPAELRALLSCADGGEELFGGWDFLSTSQIARTYGVFLEYAESTPAPIFLRALCDGGKSEGWIPFAKTGGGDFLCVDTSPGSAGVAGQVFLWQHDDAPDVPTATSVKEWLERALEILERDGAFDFTAFNPRARPIPDDSAYRAAWQPINALAQREGAATPEEIVALASYGAFLASCDAAVLEYCLDHAARAPHLGSAFAPVLRAKSPQPVITTAVRLVEACKRVGYAGPYHPIFVMNVLAAATMLPPVSLDHVLTWALALPAPPDAEISFNAACAYALLGKKTECLAYVTQALSLGKRPEDFTAEPDLKAYVEDAEFLRALAGRAPN